MLVRAKTLLDCPVEAAWAEIQKPSLLQEVMAPMASIAPVAGEPFPDRWKAGETVRCRCWVMGIPVGVRSIEFLSVDAANRRIRTHEWDPVVRRWDHTIALEPTDDGRTVYTDEVEIDAGALTPIVWAWASALYRHRQGRWRRRIVPRLTSGSPA